MIMKWTQQEIADLRSHYGNIPISQIIEKCMPSRSRNMLKAKAKQLGLHADRALMTSKSKRLYTVNSNYFTGNTLDVFYWAGFLAADGCITKDGRLQLGIATKDIDHLLKFMNTLSYDGKITQSHNGNYSVVRISDDKLIDTLKARFNLTERKSLTLEPPVVYTRRHALAFIAGYIDGDGCIHINKENRTELSCLGTFRMLSWIRYKLYPGSTSHIYKRNKIYCFKVTGFFADNIIENIKTLELPLLQRKWYQR